MVMYSIISTPNIILNPMPYYGEDLEWWVQFSRVLAQHFLLLGRGYLLWAPFPLPPPPFFLPHPTLPSPLPTLPLPLPHSPFNSPSSSLLPPSHSPFPLPTPLPTAPSPHPPKLHRLTNTLTQPSKCWSDYYRVAYLAGQVSLWQSSQPLLLPS